MSLKNCLSPYFAQLITSPKTQATVRAMAEASRKIRFAKHRVDLYFRIDDPYSYLLLQMLPSVLEDFDIQLSIKLVLDLPKEMNPEPAMLIDYSLLDAQRLAAHHNLYFPKTAKAPNRELSLQACRILLPLQNSDNFFQQALAISNALWENNRLALTDYAERLSTLSNEITEQTLKQNQQQLISHGHYLSAMLHYGNEWYWGIDRLPYLLDRLTELNTRQTKRHYGEYINLNTDHTSTDKLTPIKSTLDYYFSFRSPYSYVSLKNTFQLTTHYGIELNIKPVLPMVMRGMEVPTAKRLYILRDTKREADLNALPFGFICDPVGAGVERCMAIFNYAKQENKEKEYLLTITKGIWSEGKDTSNDSDLSELVTASGLDWQIAQSYLNENWHTWAENNRQEMFAAGLWGVPSYTYGKESIWGQDRFWAIEQAILKHNYQPEEVII